MEVKKQMEPWAYQTDLVRHKGLAVEAYRMQAAYAVGCTRKRVVLVQQQVAGHKGE